MDSPVRLLNPVELDRGVYTEIMPATRLVRGPEDGPEYVYGPPTVAEEWELQQAEIRMLERVKRADCTALERTVATILQEAQQGKLARDRHTRMLHSAMDRLATSIYAETMAGWRLVRTHWSWTEWAQEIRVGKTVGRRRSQRRRRRPVTRDF